MKTNNRGGAKRASKGASKPSERLAAAKILAANPLDEINVSVTVDGAPVGSTIMRTTSAEKVRFKWIVKHKSLVPVIVGQQIETHHLVQLEAAFEPLSILDGQAVIQGNADNRAFGIEAPKAAISMEITSQAVADTFVVGRAYHSDFTPVEPILRALY